MTIINGKRKSWTSISILFPNGEYPGCPIKSINYDYSVDSPEVFGTDTQSIGYTRGQIKFTCSVEMYLDEYEYFTEFLSKIEPDLGYAELRWDLQVHYEENGFVIADEIYGCRIIKETRSPANSAEAITVKIDLQPNRIIFNGKEPVKTRR